MKTRSEFEEDVRAISRTIVNEYADEIGIEFDTSDPGEPESDIATVTAKFYRAGDEEVFEVPFAIHNHETVIVGNRDSDIYLHADARGLYAWLFLTCLTRLADARAEA